MSRRSALIIGAGVGATVALSGAIYLLWKYSEDEEEEKSSYGSSRYIRSNVENKNASDNP